MVKALADRLAEVSVYSSYLAVRYDYLSIKMETWREPMNILKFEKTCQTIGIKSKKLIGTLVSV
jgi:hypothetical protein